MPVATDPAQLLEGWWRRVREAQWAHYRTGRLLMRCHYLVGIPLVLLSAFSGTSVFYAISTDKNGGLALAGGVTAVIAAILAGLQTFLRLPERAEQHRGVGAEYAALRRLVEQHLALTGPGAQPQREQVEAVRNRFDEIAGRAPSVPALTWRSTERALKGRP